eukprot:10494243-Prorocentrum_lima.AAC.1
MTSSLVGSEMCIRDSYRSVQDRGMLIMTTTRPSGSYQLIQLSCLCLVTVSYTHLTLPTICSV